MFPLFPLKKKRFHYNKKRFSQRPDLETIGETEILPAASKLWQFNLSPVAGRAGAKNL